MSLDFDPFLRALGRLVVNFNATELEVHRIAWRLVDPDDERVGQIVVDAVGGARVEDLVRALGRHRVRDEAIVQRLGQGMVRFAAARERRNKLVHAFWRVPNEATDLSRVEAARKPNRAQGEPTSVTKPGSFAEIEEAATDVYQLSRELEQLQFDVTAYFISRQPA